MKSMENLNKLLLKFNKKYVTASLIILILDTVIFQKHEILVIRILLMILCHTLFFLYLYYIHLITEFAFKKMNVVTINFRTTVNFVILLECAFILFILFVRNAIFKNYSFNEYEVVIGGLIIFAIMFINPFILSSLLNALELKRKLRISEHFKYYGKFYFLIFNYGVMIDKFKDLYRNNLSENNIK